jgi:RimJ/RimL family protein N-acetyltransferase
VITPDGFETERLVLRRFTMDDLDWYHDVSSRPDVVRWLYYDVLDEPAARERLARKVERRALAETGDGVSYAVVLRTTGELVGDASLFLPNAEFRQGEIGYVLHPDHHGRGYATEALVPLLDWAFTVRGLHRVAGRLEPRNSGSARVLERLGMRHEGTLLENEWIKGEWQSETVYAILAREWAAR